MVPNNFIQQGKQHWTTLKSIQVHRRLRVIHDDDSSLSEHIRGFENIANVSN